MPATFVFKKRSSGKLPFNLVEPISDRADGKPVG